MNDKFWDLKKNRQDSMINGSLKVFTRYGFRHASTDEIVAEAGISKGLLFHYFYSKSGLYAFLSEYSARFALVELDSEIRKTQALPYFDLQRKLADAESRIMRQYPYLLLFLEKARGEIGLQDKEEILSNLDLYTSRRSQLLEGAFLPAGMTAQDAARITGFLDLARLDFALKRIEAGEFSAREYVKKTEGDIAFFEGMYK